MTRADVTVLVAGRDADYLRLAAAVLTRAGFTVSTTSYRFARVERLLAAERPDVLVLEGADENLGALRRRAARTRPPVAVVIVTAGEKWGPPGDLVRRVADAADRGPRPRLTLVKS